MATEQEGADMKRRKRFNIRLVALGLAVAAIAAPAAQAVPSDPDTNRVESGLYYSAVDNTIKSPDDRKMHATWTQQSGVVDTVINSPDDRKMHATWAQQPASAVADDDSFFGTTSIVSGFVLLLVGGFGVALVARSTRKGRLAPT
jgi:hypothetical protein